MRNQIVLDLDGPVLDGKDRHYGCYLEIFGENGGEPLAAEIYWELKRNKTPLQEILEQTGAQDILQTFQQDWLARIEQMRFLELDHVWPGVEAALKKIRREGKNVILVTKRQNKINLLRQLEDYDLAECFDQIIVTGLDEQKSETLQAQSHGKDYTGAIWIGDTELDIEEARKTGAFAWAVTCGLRSPIFLERYKPDRIFPDLCSALGELT